MENDIKALERSINILGDLTIQGSDAPRLVQTVAFLHTVKNLLEQENAKANEKPEKDGEGNNTSNSEKVNEVV